MPSKPVMLLGNLTSILLTIVALLQAISWTIAGLLIIATLSITTLLPIGNPAGTSRGQTKKPTNHIALPESKNQREKTEEKQAARAHQTSGRPELKPVPKHELSRSSTQLKADFQKATIPKITPPKTIPAAVSPAKPAPMKTSPSNQPMLKPIPPRVPPAILAPPKAVPLEPVLGKPAMIGKGDYVTYDVQLEQGKSITCEMTANGRVNFYLLDDDNLTSLDLGEEFWSETGEEDTEKATLEFKAPQTGKWFLVVENAEARDVSATVNIRKTLPKAEPSA